ncbi:MAG: ATP-dependent RecD-like DNA helicase [Chloroflexota bacterium]
MDTLSGAIERITYYNEESGYTVLRLKPDRSQRSGATGLGRDGLVTVTGSLPALTPGEHLQLSGAWSNHPTYGMQFQVEICRQGLPASVEGIRRYLGSGLIKGIGPRLAERIVELFGERTLEVIEQHPEELRRVPDIGPRRVERISRAWEEQKQVKEIMLFLHSHAVSTSLAIKIYKQYGADSLAVVQNDPYRLARDIYGIGFKTADKIAQALGLPKDHPSRLEAGLVHVLGSAGDDGHTYLPQPELLQQAAELLGAPVGQLDEAITRLEGDQRIVKDFLVERETPDAGTAAALPRTTAAESGPEYQAQAAVYLAPLFHTESGLARRLQALAGAFPTRLSDIPPALTPLDAALSEEQQAAIRSALGHPLSVLTGGPGTGKTTALKALIGVLEAAHKRYALASPTGRAAKRLSQATDRPAGTIHRLLKVSPTEGFHFNAGNPLPLDMLVVDEASMLDQHLAYNLLKALEPGVHLMLVGDTDQLPSVGAGDVLRDIIAGGAAQVTRLNAIFRQAANSQIIVNAHRINQGQMPLTPERAAPGGEPGDFFLFPAETPEQAADWVVDVVTARIPQKFGLDPRSEIQVLAPMYRGAVGVTSLNERLQEKLNPPEKGRPEKRLFGQLLRLGDRVMQLTNNYDKEVYNGDIGVLSGFDEVEQNLVVEIDGRGVVYDWSEADQLVLAYAISVHKSQGAEFPAVVMPLVTQHYMMLQRNLLYTAVTRARRLCVLVGSRRAISIAVRNDQVARRNTALDIRLKR